MTSCRHSASPSSKPSFFKTLTSDTFYRILNTISGTHIVAGAADFRAMSRQAVDALKAMPEFHRFLRGMISWIGYPSVILPYHQPQRVAGRSKYSLGKMFRLASDAIFSFSLIPLYIGLSSGLVFFAMAFVQLTYVLILWITGETRARGRGLEFVDGRPAHRQRHHHDPARVHRRIRRLYFPGSETQARVSIEERGKRMSQVERPVYQFVFLRHGESTGNAESRWQGQSDYPLTERGRAQATALANRWRAEGAQFDLAASSTLVRARETAEIITSALNVPLELDEIWVERDIGEMEGLTSSEVQQRPQASVRYTL